MESKVNYTLVGAFVIVLSIFTVGILLWLTAGVQDKVYEIYRVYVRESVAGLNPQSVVRYRGVNVGRVETIQLDPGDPRRVMLTLNIEQGTPIREDTFATLSTQGITGLATVELSGGSPTSPPLIKDPEEPYPVIESAPSLVKRLDDAFTDAVQQFNQLSSSLDQILNPDNLRAIGDTLGNISKLSAALAGRADSIDRMLDNLETVSNELATSSKGFDEALTGASQALDSIARSAADLPSLLENVNGAAFAVERMADDISQTSASANQVLRDSGRDLRRLAQRTTPELNALLAELNQLSSSVQRFVEELERNPQMLLLGKPGLPAGPGE